jgi:hypothetical protein
MEAHLMSITLPLNAPTLKDSDVKGLQKEYGLGRAGLNI